MPKVIGNGPGKTRLRLTQGQRNAIIEECAKLCDKSAENATEWDHPSVKAISKMLASQIRELKRYGERE